MLCLARRLCFVRMLRFARELCFTWRRRLVESLRASLRARLPGMLLGRRSWEKLITHRRLSARTASERKHVRQDHKNTNQQKPDLRREGHMRQRKCAHGVCTRQRNAQPVCRAMRGMYSALVLASESLQYKEGREGRTGEGKAACKANGGRVAGGS